MKSSVIKVTTGLLALALLLGGFGLFAQPAVAALQLAVVAPSSDRNNDYVKKDDTFTVTATDSTANANAAAVETVAIKVKNTTRSITVSMTASETGVNTGIFTVTGTVKEVQEASLTSNQISGFTGDSISVTYSFLTKILTVDSVDPVISNYTPGKAEVVKADSTVVFSADVIDTGSGFAAKSSDLDNAEAKHGHIKIYIGGTESTGALIAQSDLVFTAIDNGWNVAYSTAFAGSATPITWQIQATDRSGNVKLLYTGGRSLVVDGTKPVISTTTTRTNDAAGSVTVTTRTGDKWDASKSAGSRHRTGTNASAKSVLVAFLEIGGLDVDTVDASDFTVGGIAPIAVTVVDIIEDNESVIDDDDRKPQEIFLSMADSQASDATPKVVLVGSVKDVAGNTAATATVTAADGIPPGITVSLNRDYHAEHVTVTVTSDESLVSVPTMTLSLRDDDPNEGDLGASSTAQTLDVIGPKSYEKKVKVSASGFGTNAREVNIQISATDVKGITGTTGKSSATDAKAITYEFDNELNNSRDPEFKVAGTAIYRTGKGQSSGKLVEIESVDPLLITINFAKDCDDDDCVTGGEKKEYKGDSHKTVTVTSSKVKVTASDASYEYLDHTVSTADNIIFTVSINNPSIGDYKVTINAEDEAGNVSTTAGATLPTDINALFEVITPKKVEVALNPGWNLISLPFQPANPSINSVIAADHPASLVMNYDNASGLWGVSRRDADSGLFTGDVSTMTASTGYFVFTNTQDPIKLVRPSLSTAAAAPGVPSAVMVNVGWNLVPVLSNGVPMPDGVSADSYLGSLKSGSAAGWLKALVWNTATQTWLSTGPGDDARTFTSGEQAAGTTYTDRCGETHTASTTVTTVDDRLCIGEGVWLWSTVNDPIIP